MPSKSDRAFDRPRPNNFADTDHRLRNIRAATFFVQTPISVLGSYREGGISAAFNLRDPSDASAIRISPPSGENAIIGSSVLSAVTSSEMPLSQ